MSWDKAITRGLFVESVRRSVVLLRDDNICGLCGLRRDPNDLTMDHVIPLAVGGPHCYDNVVAACILCNDVKAATVLDLDHPLMPRAMAAYAKLHGREFQDCMNDPHPPGVPIVIRPSPAEPVVRYRSGWPL